MSVQWTFGRQPVLEALKSRRARKVLISHSVRDAPIIRAIRELAEQTRVPTEMVPRGEVEQKAHGRSHQGVIAEVEAPATITLERMLELVAESSSRALLLLVDQIQDPRNLGSLIRSCDEFGADGLIMTERNSAGITAVVDKASAGASHHVAIAAVGNLARSLDALANAGIWTLALDPDAPQTIDECDLRGPIAIIVGNEGRGVRRLTSEKADLRARIPTGGHVGSLNASVSGAIALYEVVRQRRRS